MSVSRSLRAVAGVTALIAAACSESTGPAQLANPVTTAANVQAVASVFTVPTIAAFTSVGDLIDASGGFANAAALVRATQPEAPRPGESAYAGAARRYSAIQGLNLSPSSTLGLIPDTLKGKTFEWDTQSGHYVVTDRVGAPTDGVRFILYAINPLTHRPVEPLVEVGYVDLHDLSTDATRSLRIVVAGVDGTPTYVDYTVAGTVTPGQFVATADGSISNGESGDASKTLRFHLSATLTVAGFTFNASLTLDNPAVTITEVATASKSGNTVTLTIDFTLEEPGQTVQLKGSVTIVDGEDHAVTADLEVRVKKDGNDRLFATIKGTAPDIQILGADGQPLTEDQLHALRELFELPGRVFNFFQDLLHPVRHCFHV